MFLEQANKHIRLISKESCDIEDWSNDAENSALIKTINYILQCIHIENSFFFFIYIILLFLLYF